MAHSMTLAAVALALTIPEAQVGWVLVGRFVRVVPRP